MAVIHFPKSVATYYAQRAHAHEEKAKMYDEKILKGEPKSELLIARDKAREMARILGDAAMQHRQ